MQTSMALRLVQMNETSKVLDVNTIVKEKQKTVNELIATHGDIFEGRGKLKKYKAQLYVNKMLYRFIKK